MIEDRPSLARTPAHDLALACVEAGIEAARPERVTRDRISLDGDVLRIADSDYDLTAFDRVDNHVLADGRTAIDAAREVAREADYEPLVLSLTVRGEARDAALTHVAVAEEALPSGDPVEPPTVVLSGGECTVTVEGDGSGGPNQEFALAAAIELPEDDVLACVDTDGVDGFSEAASAIVDASTVEDRAAARDALARNDAGRYLEEHDATIRTGSTGTNVNDLRVLVLE